MELRRCGSSMVSLSVSLLLLYVDICCCHGILPSLQLHLDPFSSPITVEGATRVEICTREPRRQAMSTFYFPASSSVSVHPGQRLYHEEYEEGKIMLGPGTVAGSAQVMLKNMDDKVLHQTLWKKGQKEDMVESLFNEDMDYAVMLGVAINTTVLSLPYRNSPSHYNNRVEFSLDEGPGYSSFLSSITASQLSVPPVLDMLLDTIFPQPQHDIIVTTSLIVYLNRFMVSFKPEKNGNTTQRAGYLSSVVYGHRLHVDITMNLSLPLNQQFQPELDSIAKLLELNMEDQQPDPIPLPFNVNMTDEEEGEGQQVFMEGTDMQQLRSVISDWRQRRTQLPILSAVPIAVQVSTLPHMDIKLFHFTQCTTTQLPPLQIIALLSNILMFGIVFGLFLTLLSLMTCWVLLFSAIINRLAMMGRVRVPPFLRVHSVEIPVLQFVWPHRVHQHVE